MIFLLSLIIASETPVSVQSTVKSDLSCSSLVPGLHVPCCPGSLKGLQILRLEGLFTHGQGKGRSWVREPALVLYLQVVGSDSKEPACLMNPTNRKICQNTQNAHCRDRGNIAYLFGAGLIIFKHMQSVVH